MIKEIFLPEKTKTRRLISQRMVGISIQEETVTAAQIYATPSTTITEKLLEEKIIAGAPTRYEERLGETLKTILGKVAKYNQLRIAVPSSIVTFKELTLPFVDIEKIKMVVEYEVEPKLPFSISEAIVDFIVTDQNKENNQSQVLVAAVRKQDLQSFFNVFKEINIDPDCITVDLIASYGLYLQVPEYKELTNATAIVDIDHSSTSVAFLLNGKMRLVRNIAKGLKTISEHIAKETEKPIEEVLKKMKEQGVQNHTDKAFLESAKKHLTNFMTDIQFTLNSFSLKLNFYDDITKILFIGKGSHIKGMEHFCSTLLQIPCENFSCSKLFKTKIFRNKTKTIPQNWTDYTLALGTATIEPTHDAFNLMKKEFAKKHFPLMHKQLITAAILTIVIFATIAARGYLQIKTLRATAERREAQTIKKLKQIFPPGSSSLKKTRLSALINDASKEVSRREGAWAPFLQENLKPLEILQDLTKTIDKKLFNVQIEKVAIDSDAQGTQFIDIAGIFKSKPGEHFTDYGKFHNFFDLHSKLLSIKEKDENPVEEGEGVQFTFNLKLKEQVT